MLKRSVFVNSKHVATFLTLAEHRLEQQKCGTVETMDESSLFDSVYELGEVISRGPHSELRRCRRIGKPA